MKTFFKLIWFYLKTRWVLFTNFLGFKRDTSVIPEGQYCYSIDDERNLKEPFNGYWIKKCKYYHHISKTTHACIYLGFYGWDTCFWDQCKICGVNNEIKEEDLYP